jgi:hypothetical protein
MTATMKDGRTLSDIDAQVEQIRSHVRTRVQAFRDGDLDAASAAHEQWYRAYTAAGPAVRERYWRTARPAQERAAR